MIPRARRFAVAAVVVPVLLVGGFLIWIVGGASVEQERRMAARAMRSCSIQLSVVHMGAESLTVLRGDNWRQGCAYILAADTLAPRRTP